MAYVIDLGDTAELTLTVTEGDPTDMRVRFQPRGSQSATEVSPTIVGQEVKVAFKPPTDGWWEWRAWKAGTETFSEEGQFFVSPSAFSADP